MWDFNKKKFNFESSGVSDLPWELKEFRENGENRIYFNRQVITMVRISRGLLVTYQYDDERLVVFSK